jgi:endonuclease YncB( thermonuclease family)
MKVGSTYRIRDIQGRHWRALCQALRVDEDETIGRIDALAARAAEGASDLGARMVEDGLDAEVIERLVECIGDRARACRELLADSEAGA